MGIFLSLRLTSTLFCQPKDAQTLLKKVTLRLENNEDEDG